MSTLYSINSTCPHEWHSPGIDQLGEVGCRQSGARLSRRRRRRQLVGVGVGGVWDEVVDEHDDDEAEVDGVDGEQVVGGVHGEGWQ